MSTKRVIWECEYRHWHATRKKAQLCEENFRPSYPLVSDAEKDDIVRRIGFGGEDFKSVAHDLRVTTTTVRNRFYKRCRELYPDLSIPGDARADHGWRSSGIIPSLPAVRAFLSRQPPP